MVKSMLATLPQAIIVMDALDECTHDDNSAETGAATFLECLIEATRETKVGLLVFSRHDAQFASVIGPGPSIHMTDAVLLDDIMVFAEREYKRLKLPQHKRSTVLDLVRKSSHGSFWWAKLFLDYLSRSLTDDDFETKLHSIAPSVAHFYRCTFLSSGHLLTVEESECRGSILLLLLQAQRTLEISEIDDALSLRPDHTENIISRLFKPLVSTFDGVVQLAHPSVREFFESLERVNDCPLGISVSESHGLLAARCLLTLLKNAFGDLERLASCLRVNYDEKCDSELFSRSDHGSFYAYASRYWCHHLTHVKSPDITLLQTVDSFLVSLQFVHWAEYSQKNYGRHVGVFGPLERLKTWHRRLSTHDQTCVRVDECFESSYTMLCAAYETATLDRVSQCLSQMRLCDYYLTMAQDAKHSLIREEVVGKLMALLGPHHPIVLRTRAKIAYSKFLQGRMRAGHKIYKELVISQRHEVGEGHVRFIDALHYEGEGQYFTVDFALAAVTFMRTCAGFLGLRGPDSWSYLSAQMWYASAVAHLGQLDASLAIFQSALQALRKNYGATDSLAIVAQLGLADLLRATADYEASILHLIEALDVRRGSSSPADIFRLDAEIGLARCYQEAGMKSEAFAMLHDLEAGNNMGGNFERICQTTHIRGLVLAMDGKLDEAINVLQEGLVQAEHDQNNRSLLWIRLDLAGLLRGRNGDGDLLQAHSNFHGIIKDVSGNCEPFFLDEPDPPRLLAIAEKALTLVRWRKYEDARRLLNDEQVDWLRASDFWMWVSDCVFL
ncbi:hypothetical protein CTA1_12552 [Colletotrichum tanaceti]|uniref:MalT-like TPR region domain-containing protein n=1 Tax=Colletotrichum tanaceti TaxID=1306861 RepID=A0A4U6XF77_9PEZI|nr:hypothetical protein CTA1_12552 [Colletotrichum tanaceti]